MRKKKRLYCVHCGNTITRRDEDGILRDYCINCDVFFYDNPLPVVSTILPIDRSILLVKRKFRPYKGMWCLPSGFAEVDESIEDAAVRELEEETGVKGKIISLVDVDSCSNYFYGDLIFLTFEAVQIGGSLAPGSDTIAVKYYPVGKIPRLAFDSNTKAVRTFIQNKSDYWAIIDSFSAAVVWLARYAHVPVASTAIVKTMLFMCLPFHPACNLFVVAARHTPHLRLLVGLCRVIDLLGDEFERTVCARFHRTIEA